MLNVCSSKNWVNVAVTLRRLYALLRKIWRWFRFTEQYTTNTTTKSTKWERYRSYSSQCFRWTEFVDFTTIVIIEGFVKHQLGEFYVRIWPTSLRSRIDSKVEVMRLQIASGVCWLGTWKMIVILNRKSYLQAKRIFKWMLLLTMKIAVIGGREQTTKITWNTITSRRTHCVVQCMA